MLILWEPRLAFLATPKTGSTAIEAALEPFAALIAMRPPLLKHTTLYRYQRFIAPYLRAATGEDFATVALIREPRDWLGSWFRYRRRDGVDPEKSTANITFDAFVRAYATTPRPVFADIGSQAHFLRAKDRTTDHLFRHDRIDALTAFLEDRLARRIELPRLNVSPPGDLTLSPEAEGLLRTTFAADYEIYESCA
ncbi:hypothetical protein [Falsirhodobacter xinxiangensis]|uniref:hypothetical protein n=1 Tax=Falsirhodobacter xinxiangensis TaxID=2530049 RepID=UPI0010AAB726|nr:hypothetical protein [Rhodobacter xinxiangensis]